MARIITISSVLIALFISASVPYVYAQPSLSLVTQTTLNGTSRIKFPSVAVANGNVHVATNNDGSDAYYFVKAEAATSFGSQFDVGDAEGAPDYTNASVAAAPDGATYVAWINQDEKIIYIRRREANGNYGPIRIVDRNSSFPYNLSITVASDGAIFAAWLEPDRPPRARRGTDQGATWSARLETGDYVGYNNPIDIAAGPNGTVALGFTGSIEPISAIVGIWNGTRFASQIVAGNGAAPSVTYAPNGKLYVAWRGASDRSGDLGMFYAEQQPNGTFPRSRLAGSNVGSVAVSADQQNNVHFAWTAPAGRDLELYYTVRTANGEFGNPIAAQREGSSPYNISGAANASEAAYMHVVAESFSGNVSRVRYSLFSSGSAGVNAAPTIEAGAALTRRNDNQVSVSFQVTGPTPNQIRYRWGAPPSDTQFDSTGAQGWETYANPKLVAVPERIRNVCGEQVLYTQVRVTGGVTEITAKSDGITIDSAVTRPGVIDGLNPYSAEAANDPVGTEQAAELTAGSASNTGDPNYTRIDAVNIEIDNSTDCSGLDTVSIGKTAQNLTTPDLIVNNRFDKRIFFPDNSLVPGRNDYIIQLKDKAGNTIDIADTIYYDDSDPVLVTGTLTLSPTLNSTLLVDLQFSNVNVTDSIYDNNGRKFWGVWVAVSRTAVDPNTASNLVWVPLKASGSGDSFVIEDFSLASGLASTNVTPGDYYVYARFLDGAGNSTDGFLTASRTITVVEGPQLRLPLVRK
jgi:hypothetical protein